MCVCVWCVCACVVGDRKKEGMSDWNMSVMECVCVECVLCVYAKMQRSYWPQESGFEE